MVRGLKIGDIELIWLNGGRFGLDGGAMFGVVPKALWDKKYPSDEGNYIPLAAWPILIKTEEKLILIESGLGNKLDEKQKKIFRVSEEWNILSDLHELGIQRDDIDMVILTHYDFDHAGGVVMREDNGSLTLTFPNAQHIIQQKEWEDVLNPNKRSVHTFWHINYELLKESKHLHLINGTVEIHRGVTVIHTGGHNRGHQVVSVESQNEKAFHLADLLPTHAHFNPLWIMAYDNFPLEVISLKEEWEHIALRDNAWLTFYHDPIVLACKFDEKGNITEKFPG